MPALRSKILSLAVAGALVPDGCRLALGGFAVYQHPMAFVRELVRRFLGGGRSVSRAVGPKY